MVQQNNPTKAEKGPKITEIVFKVILKGEFNSVEEAEDRVFKK